MKIAVIGGTGLIGSQVVKILEASGHEAVPHSLDTGVDLLSGRGLPEALKDTGVVVNLTNSPTFDDSSPAFFQTTMDNLLTAAFIFLTILYGAVALGARHSDAAPNKLKPTSSENRVPRP